MDNSPWQNTPKLNVFKDIFDTCKTSNPVLNFFIFAILSWLEERYIDYKTKVAIDLAEIQYHHDASLLEQQQNLPPLIIESPSPIPHLPELHIHNPVVN